MQMSAVIDRACTGSLVLSATCAGVEAVRTCTQKPIINDTFHLLCSDFQPQWPSMAAPEDIRGDMGRPTTSRDENRSDPTRKLPKPNATILRVLTFTQNTSALVFAVFVPMHLASPVVAAFGGLPMADKALVGTRDRLVTRECTVFRFRAQNRITGHS
jgi:hypothetical protein